MMNRGYKCDEKWKLHTYRGKIIGYDYSEFTSNEVDLPYGMFGETDGDVWIYPEHDDKYLKECIENLKRKGVRIDISKIFLDLC